MTGEDRPGRGADAAPAWFAVLVGSPETAPEVFEQARQRLRSTWRQRSASSVLRGGSIAPGDPLRYLNQVLVLDHSGAGHGDIVATLKALEAALGRRPQQHPPVIDLDFLSEYAHDGAECWRDAAKLAHPAFRDLLAEALALARSGEG